MAIIIILLIFLAKVDANLSNGMSLNSHAACPENGKQALLNFKKGFIDEANRIASWDPHHHPDCCRWFGVVCDNMTGHILSLNLSVPPLDEDNLISRLTSKLEGKINPCLSNLKHLRFLDLSGNQFEGLLPYQLGNLSNLQYLNLGDNGLYVQSLQWLSGLPLLKHLDLSSMDLSRASNWLQLVNTLLPSLEELHLSLCQLVPGPPLLNLNLSSLAILDLSYNDFSNQMDLRWVSKLNSLYNFSTLQVLRLYGNELQGDISSAIFNIRTLSELDLSWNDPEEKLPRAAGKLCKLRSIDLSGIRLNRDISHIFEILSVCSSLRLESLAFSSCQLSGQLTDQLEHFKNLKELFLDSNSISGPIPTSLGQLANLEWLGSWQIGPSFPLWLRSQKHLEYLDISNSRISDVIPRWFWGLSTQFRDGNLSRNQISGQIQYLPQSQVYFFVDLSFNNFSGPLPRISVGPNMGPFFAGFVKLSNNYFSGSLFHFLCYQGNDTLPMVALSLANNLLSGEIPDCWIKWQYLRVLRLDGNRVSGKIPISIGTLTKLQSLHLHNNRLHGEIPL
ncbi:receptor-like protein EIX2 [Gossypium arboreum]|uniref:receptor-like protein EIX2 n=1 Tax=Gossypium arboreum TaxID=29729 RepID=UPI0008191EB1|nr:receptor-like protein EIX2 [Gossypium arboreum]